MSFNNHDLSPAKTFARFCKQTSSVVVQEGGQSLYSLAVQNVETETFLFIIHSVE